MVLQLASALLPVFFVMGLGFAAGRLRVVDNMHVDGLNTIVMSIALPISLFTVLAASARHDVIEHWPLVVVVLAVMVAVYAITWFVQRTAFKRSAVESAVDALTVSFPNAAAVGIPLAAAVLGATGQLAVAIVLAVGSITVSPFTILVLERAKAGEQRRPLPVLLLHSLLKPVVVAPLLGLAWCLTGIPLPQLASDSLMLIGSVTAGLALFLTGLVVSAQRIRIDLGSVAGTVIGGLGRPLLAFAAVLLFRIPQPMAAEAMLLLTLPSGFFGILLGLRYGAKPPSAGTTLLLSTLLSAIALSILIAFLPSS